MSQTQNMPFCSIDTKKHHIYVVEQTKYYNNGGIQSTIYNMISNIKAKEWEKDGDAATFKWKEIKNYNINLPDLTFKNEKKFKLISAENDYLGEYIQINFVGFMLIQVNLEVNRPNGKTVEAMDFTLISLPKYMDKLKMSWLEKTGDEIEIERAKVNEDCYEKYENLQCIFKMYKKPLAQKDALFHECEKNEIGFAEKVLRYYVDYGLYSHREKEYQTRKGKVSWDKTVKKISPDLINGFPIYKKPIRERYIDSNTTISDIQACILNTLQNKFGNILGYKLDIPDSSWNIDDLKNNEWVINLINSEKSFCFKDFDIMTLDYMLKYLRQEYEQSFIFKDVYAVAKYENIFEVVLGDFLGNQVETYKRKYSNWVINVSFDSKHKNQNDEFIQIDDCRDYSNIEWHFEQTIDNKNIETPASNNGLLIPDIIFEHYDWSVIVDAKYYFFKPILKNNKWQMQSVPDNESIFKQVAYLQLLAEIYKSEMPKEQQQNIQFLNTFIFPWFETEKGSENSLFRYAGKVKYNHNVIHLVTINLEILTKIICSKEWELNKIGQRVSNQKSLINTINNKIIEPHYCVTTNYGRKFYHKNRVCTYMGKLKIDYEFSNESEAVEKGYCACPTCCKNQGGLR